MLSSLHILKKMGIEKSAYRAKMKFIAWTGDREKEGEIILHLYEMQYWILIFFAYCIVGWVWETGFVSLRKRKFVNRGFLNGPWIPIYGFGAIEILFLTLPLRENLFLVFVVGMIGATMLEYVTGWTMEKIFKVKYWDYSKQKIQFRGYICLSSSVFWGFLSIAMIKWIHAPFERIVLSMTREVAMVVDIVLGVLFVTDIGFSVKEALDLRKVLVALEQIAGELDEAHKQFAERMEQGRQQLENQLESKVRGLRERREIQLQKLRLANEKLLKRHPSASFKRVEGIIEEMKNRLEEWDKRSGR